jgi:hypothetical protein
MYELYQDADHSVPPTLAPRQPGGACGTRERLEFVGMLKRPRYLSLADDCAAGAKASSTRS